MPTERPAQGTWLRTGRQKRARDADATGPADVIPSGRPADGGGGWPPHSGRPADGGGGDGEGGTRDHTADPIIRPVDHAVDQC